MLEDADLSLLLSELPLRSLRQDVKLVAHTEGARADAAWQPRLRMHRRNVLRFLRRAGAELPEQWAELWPPIVETVRSLRVQAQADGRILGPWEDSSYLGASGAGLKLYVRGQGTATRDIVDAIATLYGIEPGLKTLLVTVLDADSEARGAECLDYDNVPRLPGEEDRCNEVREVLEFDLPDAPGGDLVEMETDLPETPSSAAHGGTSLDGGEQIERFVPARPSPPPSVAAPDHSDEVLPPPRLEPPRVAVDYGGLAAKGYKVEPRVAAGVAGLDLEDADDALDPEEPELRKCALSFYDVVNGFLPIKRRQVRALSGAGGLRTVHFFGEHYKAEQAGDFHVRVKGAVALFERYQVVAGTVVYLRAGAPGVIEAELHEDEHLVANVWLLRAGREREARPRAATSGRGALGDRRHCL